MTLVSGLYSPSKRHEDVEARLRAAGARFTVLSDIDLLQSCVDTLEAG
jgi:hypothetical protein